MHYRDMNNSKSITINLSPEDFDRLEAEAKRLKLSLETLATRILHTNLAHTEGRIDPHEALERLREIGRKLPPVDTVELVRASREELEQRGIF